MQGRGGGGGGDGGGCGCGGDGVVVVGGGGGGGGKRQSCSVAESVDVCPVAPAAGVERCDECGTRGDEARVVRIHTLEMVPLPFLVLVVVPVLGSH